MTLAKICGVTTVEDARVAADAGADAIGLNFYPRSPRCISTARAAEISSSLPPALWRVGVFVDAPRDEIERTVHQAGLDTIQLHGNENPEMAREWNCRVIKAVRVRDAASVRSGLKFDCDFLLADAYVAGEMGGTGQLARWDLLDSIPHDRLILAGGLNPDNVGEAVRRVHPAMVDVASGVESKPGHKDHHLVRRFITNAKSA